MSVLFFNDQVMCDTDIHPSPGRESKTVRVRDGMGPKEDLETNRDKGGRRLLGVSGAHFLEHKIVILWFDLPSSFNEELQNVPLYLISSREKGRKET